MAKAATRRKSIEPETKAAKPEKTAAKKKSAAPPAAAPRVTEHARIEAKRGTATIYLGDCLEGMREHVADASVDVVVTSPPYNIGIRYGTYKDDLPRDKYLAWIEEVSREVARVLKPGGSFFLNVGNKPSDPWIAWDVAQQVRKKFALQNTIHWVKAISIAKADAGSASGLASDVSVGHYKPINSDRYLNDAHEFVFHFTHEGDAKIDRLAVGVPYQDKSNIARWDKTGGRDLRCRGNLWFVPYETIQQRDKDRPHPATFPVRLVEMCLKIAGAKAGSVVLDPFLGIGTTAIAAARVGADSIGFDIDLGYLRIAEERVREELARLL